MIVVPAQFAAVLWDKSATLIPLIEIIPDELDDTQTIRRARWPQGDVRFPLGGADEKLYLAEDFEFSAPEVNLRSERSVFELAIQNRVDAAGNPRPWSSYWKGAPINGAKVRTHLVAELLLADPDSDLPESEWVVSGWHLDGDLIKMRIGPPEDIFEGDYPRQPIGGDICVLEYKGPI